MLDKEDRLGIFVHGSDNDGFFSGYLAKLKYPYADIHYIEYGYDDIKELISYDRVILIDMTLKPSIINTMLSKGVDIEVYDHHKSAYPVYSDLQLLGVKYYYRENACGAMIFAQEHKLPITDTLRLIDRYDRFDFNSTDVFAKEYALTAGTTLLDMKDFDTVDSLMQCNEPIIKDGRLLIQAGINKLKWLLASANLINLAGKRVLAINHTRIQPEMLKSAGYNGDADIVMSYRKDKDKWIYSLRSLNGTKTVDIAKIYGGGGHDLASGFTTPQLLKELL